MNGGLVVEYGICLKFIANKSTNLWNFECVTCMKQPNMVHGSHFLFEEPII
jgi:hypothetical protein